MWIGSKRHYIEKPFSIKFKWPGEPIEALAVYFTYDQKLLKEKNFIEWLDSIKKNINIWSARGLSIYGKVTIIKSFLIPKYIYVCSILQTPKELLKELNKILFEFLWKGVDKVTTTSQDYTIPCQFYREPLLWKLQFRETLATEEDWNNKEIKVENKPVYYKHYVDARVICIQDLLFSLNSTDCYYELSNKICKQIF